MNDIHLRVLDVFISGDISEMTASLISYLSSAGDLLESLKVRSQRAYTIDDLLVSLAKSCPKLTLLRLFNYMACNMENLRLLYEQCLHLQYVFIDEVIDTNTERHYKKVNLIHEEDFYHPVGNLKSLLEPYQICLETSATEEALISLLQDLPHLNSLCMTPFIGNHYTDVTLEAITHSCVRFVDLNSDGFRFSDKLMSELIETCQLLERLKMPCYGLESLVAVSKHSSLRFVDLTMIVSVTIKMLDGLLLDDKVTWPSSLEERTIRSDEYRCYYMFNKESRNWTKYKRK
eukprot:scaffold921_cov190-Ochromonas_danica.AAC.8